MRVCVVVWWGDSLVVCGGGWCVGRVSFGAVGWLGIISVFFRFVYGGFFQFFTKGEGWVRKLSHDNCEKLSFLLRN